MYQLDTQLNSPASIFAIQLEKANYNEKGKETKAPILKSLLPTLLTLQALSIFPIQYNSTTTSYKHSWASLPVAVNVGLFITCLYSAVVTHFSVQSYAEEQNVNGTDYFSAQINLSTGMFSTLITIAAGNINAFKFCEGLQKMANIVEALGTKEFKKIRLYSYCVPVCAGAQLLFMLGIYVITSLEHRTIPVPPLAMFAVTYMNSLITIALPSSFVVFILTCRILFKNYNEMVKVELARSEFEMSHLRKLHQDLCTTISTVVDAFGVQVFAIFVATCFRFIVGIYVILVDVSGIGPSAYQTFWGELLLTVVAGCRILAVIISTELLLSQERELIAILEGIMSTTSHVPQQVESYLGKLRHSKLEVKWCGFFRPDYGFLSTAIPATFAYLLVLIQFKQADNK